jgi:hypothetical protein
LRKKKNLQEIEDFCLDKGVFCREHREYVCKSILKLSGYNTTGDFNYCKLYGEMMEIRKKIPTNKNKSHPDYLKANKLFLEQIVYDASDSLRDFFIFNGYDIPQKSIVNRIVKVFSKSIQDLPTIIG